MGSMTFLCRIWWRDSPRCVLVCPSQPALSSTLHRSGHHPGLSVHPEGPDYTPLERIRLRAFSKSGPPTRINGAVPLLVVNFQHATKCSDNSQLNSPLIWVVSNNTDAVGDPLGLRPNHGQAGVIHLDEKRAFRGSGVGVRTGQRVCTAIRCI